MWDVVDKSLTARGISTPSTGAQAHPPSVKPQVAAKKLRVLTEGRIISGSDMLLQLKVILDLRHILFIYLVGLTFLFVFYMILMCL